jgi:hypothetical protein
VYRVRNLSAEEITSQIRSYSEKNGYTIAPESLRVMSSPRNFDIRINLIPFEREDYIDIKVDLYRKY